MGPPPQFTIIPRVLKNGRGRWKTHRNVQEEEAGKFEARATLHLPVLTLTLEAGAVSQGTGATSRS